MVVARRGRGGRGKKGKHDCQGDACTLSAGDLLRTALIMCWTRFLHIICNAVFGADRDRAPLPRGSSAQQSF